MTDDELIMLWSLAGMELWAEFKRDIDLDNYVNRRITINSSNKFPLLIKTYLIWNIEGAFLLRIINTGNYLYCIDDILTFNPDERWWKLLFAKRWYEKNKEQFV